jgi:hypothetical protein
MKKIIIILLSVLAVILLAIATLGLILATQPQTQGKEIPTSNEYSFTKAVCTEGNFCQDVVIACKNKQTVSITPIQGAFAQFSPKWQDPRTQEQIEKECN